MRPDGGDQGNRGRYRRYRRDDQRVEADRAAGAPAGQRLHQRQRCPLLEGGARLRVTERCARTGTDTPAKERLLRQPGAESLMRRDEGGPGWRRRDEDGNAGVGAGTPAWRQAGTDAGGRCRLPESGTSLRLTCDRQEPDAAAGAAAGQRQLRLDCPLGAERRLDRRRQDGSAGIAAGASLAENLRDARPAGCAACRKTGPLPGLRSGAPALEETRPLLNGGATLALTGPCSG